ncbi:hypothetical protein GCM10028771_02430 [Nocardioides marmoraquaticus]
MPSAPQVRCPDCKLLHDGPGRCPRCRRIRDAARGRRQRRGYDAHHDQVGRHYQQQLEGGRSYRCWRCGRPITGARRGVDWQLGHCDDDKTVHHGPEHPRCNQATSGRAGQPCPHPMHVEHGTTERPDGGGG